MYPLLAGKNFTSVPRTTVVVRRFMSSDHSLGMLASMRLVVIPRPLGVGVVIPRIEPFLVSCVNSPLEIEVVKDAGAVG